MNDPVRVEGGVYLVDLTRISDVDNTFQVEFDIIGFWNDPRLAFDAAAAGSDRRVFVGPAAENFRTQIWNSQITAVNAVGNLNVISQKWTVFSDGRLMVEARVSATLRTNLDYRNFPFDEQVLPIHLESFAWNRDILRLSEIPDQTGFDPNFKMPEWNVAAVTAVVSESKRPRDPVPFSRLSFEIKVAREWGFYVWKIFVPLFIIVAISWVVFWMGSETIGRRAGVSVTGILTVIAYQFIVAASIPRVSYLTILDKFILLSVVMIASTLVVSVTVDGLKSRGRDGDAVDRICRWVFPLAYYGTIAFVVIQSLT